MKKIFITIPALLALSGCVTSLQGELEYRKQCSNLEKPYFRKDLFNKFLIEKNIIVVNNYSNECYLDSVCRLLMYKDRWNNIKIVNDKKESIIYYRDYSLKNCKEEGILGPNIYKENNKNFCVGIKQDESDIAFNIKYESDSNYVYKNKSVVVKRKYDKLSYKNEIFLNREAIIFQAPTGNSNCNSDQNISDLLIQNI